MLNQKPLTGQSVVLDVAAGRVFRLRKSVMTTARLVNDRLKVPANNPNGWRFVPLMVTYTYRPGVEWKPEHLSDTIKTMQKWAIRLMGFSLPYVWVMELTKAGVPHYHLIVWMPARFQMPKHDKRGWWKHGHTRVERVRNAVGYVAKYASKFGSKDAEFPKSARIHGTGGLTEHERRVVAWWKLPKDIRRGEEGSEVWRRAPGGGWYNLETKERIYSTWRLAAFHPGGKFVRIEQVAADPEGSHMREHLGYVSQEERNMVPLEVRRRLVDERSNDNSSYRDFVLAKAEAWKHEAMALSLRLGHLLETDRVSWVEGISEMVEPRRYADTSHE